VATAPRARRGRAAGTAALLAAALLVAPGCGGSGDAPGKDVATPAETPQRGGTLVVALRGDVDSWNPYTAGQAAAANVLELVYPRLVRERFGAGEAGLVPWAARSWSFSPDRRTLTFALDPRARWSDGSPLRCEDVAFTLAMQRDEALAWDGAFLKEAIEAVECPDPATAVFRFARPSSYQALDANDDALVPAAYRAVPPAQWAETRWETRAVTAGPFRIESVKPGQEAVLARDPQFWIEGRPFLDRVVFRVYPDAAAALAALEAGEVDVLDKLPPLRAKELVARGGIAVVEAPGLAYTFVGWNALDPAAYAADRRARGCAADAPCAESAADIRRLQRSHPHPVLSDPRVRRALTLATDREDIVQGVLGGYGRVGVSPIVSALGDAFDPSAALPFDPARAAALLDEAGWSGRDPDGVRRKGSRRLELSVIADAENGSRRDALERMAASLARVGVRLTAEPLPRTEFLARARDKRFDGVISGWRAGSRIEPQAILHSDAAAGRGNNLGAWSTPESDALLDRAAAAASPAEALPLWREWQALFREEQPYTVLYEERTLVGLSPRVRGATPSPLSPYDGLEAWWIAPAAGPPR
jgi:peptide/nickel transport system substrate-binding protein